MVTWNDEADAKVRSHFPCKMHSFSVQGAPRLTSFADLSASPPSIAGVVTHSDNLLGQWPASIRTQGHRVEMVENLTAMVRGRLAAWKEKEPPGVLESQYGPVLTVKLPPIK